MSSEQRTGFGIATCVMVVAAIAFALAIDVPDELPGIAMNAPWIFRLEAGALAAIVFYVLLLAILLAFNGRGFTKLGPGGVDTDSLVAVDQANDAIQGLRDSLHELSDAQIVAIGDFTTRLAELEARLPAPPPAEPTGPQA